MEFGRGRDERRGYFEFNMKNRNLQCYRDVVFGLLWLLFTTGIVDTMSLPTAIIIATSVENKFPW